MNLNKVKVEFYQLYHIKIQLMNFNQEAIIINKILLNQNSMIF